MHVGVELHEDEEVNDDLDDGMFRVSAEWGMARGEGREHRWGEWKRV